MEQSLGLSHVFAQQFIIRLRSNPTVTLKDVIAAKFGDVRVMGDEVVQEICELVALPERHVGTHQVLVNHSQVEVVAEGVDVHQVPHLIALLSEQHGELQQSRSQHQDAAG